jgi:hypothetical protein
VSESVRGQMSPEGRRREGEKRERKYEGDREE